MDDFTLDYIDRLENENCLLKERLEALEKENQILKMSVKDTYDTGQEIISELKEELQISKDNEKTQKWFNDNQFNLIRKYQKAFEILKGRVCAHNGYICYSAYADIPLTQQESELIREVLGNEE